MHPTELPAARARDAVRARRRANAAPALWETSWLLPEIRVRVLLGRDTCLQRAEGQVDRLDPAAGPPELQVDRLPGAEGRQRGAEGLRAGGGHAVDLQHDVSGPYTCLRGRPARCDRDDPGSRRLPV